jgi:dTDP-glucose pyrophosphorylase
MKCYGILPMAGQGKRLRPLAFSKELYPIVYKAKHFAISEFSIKALLKAKVDEIKLIIHPNKLDIAEYYSRYSIPLSIYFYKSASLPESCLLPICGMHDNDLCLFGLPDTLFSPANSYKQIRKELEGGADICLGLFHVNDGSKFDSVKIGKNNQVKDVLVKKSPPLSNWIWGIWGANVKTLKLLKREIIKQRQKEPLLGKGFHALAQNKNINFKARKLGRKYFDIGTMDAVVNANKIIKNNFVFE